MPIRAIVFDFGDVLMRDQDRSGRKEWEERLGLREGELDRLVFRSAMMPGLMIGQGSVDDLWQDIGVQLSLSAAEIQQLQSDFWRSSQLDAEIIAFLRGLRPRYRTAILSDAWPGIRTVFIETLGLGEVFDEMIISSEEGIAKPDRRIFEIALRRLDVEPTEAIFVDDQPANIAGAQALGMHGILFTNTADVLAHITGMLTDDG